MLSKSKVEEENLEKKEHLHRKHADEFRDIINRFPNRFNLILLFSLILVVVIAFCFGWFIKSPDIVIAEVKVTATKPPVASVSPISGKIKTIAVSPKDSVQKGEYLVVFDNLADTEEVKRLRDSITKHSTNELIQTNQFAEFLRSDLGELQKPLYDLNAIYLKYDIARNSPKYRNEQSTIDQRIALNEELNQKQQEIISIKDKEIYLSQSIYETDQSLFEKGAIVMPEVQASERNYYITLGDKKNYESSIIRNNLEIANLEYQKEQIKIERRELIDQLSIEALASYNTLLTSIKDWENKYVIKAPFDGVVEYLTFIEQDQFVEAGRPIISTLPFNNEIIGRALLPTLGAGKVEVGQEVIIKLSSFPHQEYGYLEGKVSSMSILPSDGLYLVEIEIPNQLKSNIGLDLSLGKETDGTAEIITKKRRLIHRLIDKVQYAFDSNKRKPLEEKENDKNK